MMNASFVLEIFLAVLLVAALAYCWRVERSLSQFRASRAQMDATARELLMAVSKAEVAINSLRHASQEAGSQLQDRVSEARALADELAVMSGAASQRLNRLDSRQDIAPKVRLDERPEIFAPHARMQEGARTKDDARKSPPVWNR